MSRPVTGCHTFQMNEPIFFFYIDKGIIKNSKSEAAEIVQLLILATLAEYWVRFPVPTFCLTIACNSSCSESNAIFWELCAPAIHVIHIHACTHTYIHACTNKHTHTQPDAGFEKALTITLSVVLHLCIHSPSTFVTVDSVGSDTRH